MQVVLYDGCKMVVLVVVVVVVDLVVLYCQPKKVVFRQ